MNPETKRKIQIVLLVAIAVAGIRAAYVVYQRRGDHKAVEAEKKEAPPLMADYYVTPKRMRPYDLKSAKALTEQPVWVKEGYKYSYYPFDSARRNVGFLARSWNTAANPEIADQGCGDGRFAWIRRTKADNGGLRTGRKELCPCRSDRCRAANYQIYSDEMFLHPRPAGPLQALAC